MHDLNSSPMDGELLVISGSAFRQVAIATRPFWFTIRSLILRPNKEINHGCVVAAFCYLANFGSGG